MEGLLSRFGTGSHRTYHNFIDLEIQSKKSKKDLVRVSLILVLNRDYFYVTASSRKRIEDARREEGEDSSRCEISESPRDSSTRTHKGAG